MPAKDLLPDLLPEEAKSNVLVEVDRRKPPTNKKSFFDNFIEIMAKDVFKKAIERWEEEGKLEMMNKKEDDIIAILEKIQRETVDVGLISLFLLVGFWGLMVICYWSDG